MVMYDAIAEQVQMRLILTENVFFFTKYLSTCIPWTDLYISGNINPIDHNVFVVFLS